MNGAGLVKGRAEPPQAPETQPGQVGELSGSGVRMRVVGGLLAVAGGSGAHIHKIILPGSHSFRHTHMMYTET